LSSTFLKDFQIVLASAVFSAGLSEDFPLTAYSVYSRVKELSRLYVEKIYKKKTRFKEAGLTRCVMD